MIQAVNISKKFDQFEAIRNVSLTIKECSVFGMIGTNGAGKSTMLRMLAGVLKPDSGTILADEKPVWNNEAAKRLFYFIADDPYFFANGTPDAMGKYLKTVYPDFDIQKFEQYLSQFGLEKKRKIRTFSKGMKKQLAILCGLSARTKYLFCDETFDGLDPVMRQAVKSIFASEMEERGLTPVIASHNLRELEDICDHIGLLHRGGILLSRELEDMKCNLLKVQCVFSTEEAAKEALSKLTVRKMEERGSLYMLTVEGEKEEILGVLKSVPTVFYEVLALSLEEIFISETEVLGYDIKKIIFG